MSIFFLAILMFTSLMTLFRTILARTVDQEASLSDFSESVSHGGSGYHIKTDSKTRHNDRWKELYRGGFYGNQNLQKRGQIQSKGRKKPSEPPSPPPPRIISVASLGGSRLSGSPPIPISGSTPRSARSGVSVPRSSGGTSRAGSASYSPTSPQHRPPIVPSSAPSERRSWTAGRPDTRPSLAAGLALLRTASGPELSQDSPKIFRRPEPGSVPLWATSSSEDISFDLTGRSGSSGRSKSPINKPSLNKPSTSRPSISRPSTSRPSTSRQTAGSPPASRNEAQNVLMSSQSRLVSTGSSGTSSSRRPSMLGDPSRASTAADLMTSTGRSPRTPEQVSEKPPNPSSRDSEKSKSQNTEIGRPITSQSQDRAKAGRQSSVGSALAPTESRPDNKPPVEQAAKPALPAKESSSRPPAVQASAPPPPSSRALMRAHKATSNFYNRLGSLPPTSDAERNAKNARWGQLGKVHNIAAKYYTHNAAAMESPTSGPASSLPQLLEAKPDATKQASHQTVANFYNRLRRTQSADDAESKAKQQQYRILSKYHGAASDYFAPSASPIPSVITSAAPPAAPAAPADPNSIPSIARLTSLSTSRISANTRPISRSSMAQPPSRPISTTQPGSGSSVLTQPVSHPFMKPPTDKSTAYTRPVSGPLSVMEPIDKSYAYTRPVRDQQSSSDGTSRRDGETATCSGDTCPEPGRSNVEAIKKKLGIRSPSVR